MMSALAQWSTVDPGDMSDVDLHIQQTNDRLQCIQQHLLSPSSYPSAARELLEWCSDTRAFQWQFEQHLMGCLTVVSQVAGQFGYDLDLGYRLLAVCAAHRDKLTPKSAGLLSVWCEELGRLLLLRHHKVDPNNTANSNSTTSNSNNNSSNTSCGMQMPVLQNHPMLQNSNSSSPEMQQWSSIPQPQKSLSVVTSSYSGTQLQGSYANKVLHNSSILPGFDAATSLMQKPPYDNTTVVYNRLTSGTVYNQRNDFSSGSVGSQMNCTQGGSTSPDTLSVATALVSGTTSAVVTATASAGVVCMGEGNQPKPSILSSNQFATQMSTTCSQQYGRLYNSNPSNCFGSLFPGPHGMHSSSMGPGRQTLSPVETGAVQPTPLQCGPVPCGGQVLMKTGSAMMQSGAYGPQRRPAPYPNPQLYMQSKRGPYPNDHQGIVSESVFGIQSYGMAPQSQYGWNKPGLVHSQQAIPMANYCSVSGQPNAPFCGGQPRFLQPGMGGNAASQCHPTSLGYTSQFNSMQNYPMSNMTSPIFDNLTPPMTPAALTSAPLYVSPSVDPLPNKPMMVMKAKSEDLRLTFPVRDGVVLPSFRLEHNLAVSNHVFHLRDSVYQTLMWRPDLELQLKCFHHEDHQMNTNWPASVTVSVNATPLTIERGDNKSIHRPLYLKDVCQPGRNTIQITVTACCCSHLFVLQLVHRPSVKSVLQGLLRKRLLPAEHCITKIKRSFLAQPVTHSSQTLREEGVEQTAIKVSLKCPITYQYIALPVRGHDCKHIQCFDLESYLRLNCDRGTWRCPICNKPALLEGLEIDQYIWGILQTLAGTQFEEVTVDTTASWKPVPVKTMKEEDKDLCIQRWKKAISPSSMKLPTMNTWQDSSFSTNNSSQPVVYPMSPQGQSIYNSPNGSQYCEGHLGANPCFPPSSSPDFLSSLSQMGDSLLCSSSGGGGGVAEGESEKTSTAIHQYSPCLDIPLMHPPTPLDGQGSLPHTPINGLSRHRHTPLDVHGSYAESHLGTFGTPLDGQQGSMKLRHATPGSPTSVSVGNPHTPSNLSASCGGSVGPPTHNSSSNSSSFYDATLTGAKGTHDNKESQAPFSHNCSTQSSDTKAAESDLSLGINFDPDSMMDSDSQSQEVLDLLPDNIGDPTELLSYLGPMDNRCNGENNNAINNDEILSLFS